MTIGSVMVRLWRRPGLRRSLIGVVIAAVLGTAALVALPVAAAWYGERWLADRGAPGARIDDVDFNPFTGVARVTGLSAGAASGRRLRVGFAEINVRWWPLTDRRVYVQDVLVRDAQVDLSAEDGVFSVGGLTFPPEPGAGETAAEPEPVESVWGFGSDRVQLTDVEVTYRDGLVDKVLEIHELVLGAQFSWDQSRTTPLVVDVAVDGSPLVLESDVMPWSEAPSLSGAVTLRNLRLEDYGTLLETLAGLEDPRGTVGLELEVSVSRHAGGGLQLAVDGPLTVDGLAFHREGTELSQDTLRWDGQVALNFPAPADGPLLRVSGSLQSQGLRAALAAPALAAQLAGFDWTGEISLLGPDAAGESRFAGVSQLAASGLDVTLLEAPMQVIGFERLEVRDVAPQHPRRGAAAGLVLHGLGLVTSGDQAPLLAVDELAVDGMSLDQRTLTANSVALRNPKVRAVRNEAGALEGLGTLQAALQPGTDGEEEAADVPAEDGVAAEPFVYRVGSLTIRGEQWVDLVDRAVTPPARLQLDSVDLGVEGIDSGGADPVSVRFSTGDGSLSLAVDGHLQLFGPSRSADLKVDLQALDLTRVSPYLPGYNIERGRLSSDSTVQVAGDALDVRNRVLIERLKLAGKGVDDGLLSQGMAMPVDVALDLLRDRNDHIRLALPVTGSLSDPQFGTGDIVRLAMQKALQNAALSYVKNALQPLGTLLLVGNLAAQAARPRFEPVAMTPGRSDLPAGVTAYLDKLGTLLAERPGLQLTVCGVAAPADRAVLQAARTPAPEPAAEAPPAAPEGAGSTGSAEDGEAPAVAPVSDEELLELARLRTAAVITALAGRDGVSRARLFACRETIETGAEAEPRVEVTL